MRTKMFIAAAAIVAVATFGGLALFILSATNSDDSVTLADHLESRIVDGVVYPRFRSTEAQEDTNIDVLMYGQAQSLVAVAGLGDERYVEVLNQVVEYLSGSPQYPASLTASLLLALPEASSREAGATYIRQHMARAVVEPGNYQSYASVADVFRSRFWTSQSAEVEVVIAGAQRPSCAAVAEAVAHGQLRSIGSLAIVDPTIRTRCDHKEFSLDSVLNGASPALIVEVLALDEAGWITASGLSDFQAQFEAEVDRYRETQPLWLSLGVAIGVEQPGDSSMFIELLASAEARSRGQSVPAADALSLWLMHDIAKLAGTRLTIDPTQATDGLTEAEVAVFRIIGADVSDVDQRSGDSLGTAMHYWIMAIDLVDATGSCDGLEALGPPASTPLIVEAFQYVAGVCGPDFAEFDGPKLSVAQVADPVLGMAQPLDLQRAVSRALECRLGLSPDAPEVRNEPYPTELWSLWTVAVLTETCDGLPLDVGLGDDVHVFHAAARCVRISERGLCHANLGATQ